MRLREQTVYSFSIFMFFFHKFFFSLSLSLSLSIIHLHKFTSLSNTYTLYHSWFILLSFSPSPFLLEMSLSISHFHLFYPVSLFSGHFTKLFCSKLWRPIQWSSRTFKSKFVQKYNFYECRKYAKLLRHVNFFFKENYSRV